MSTIIKPPTSPRTFTVPAVKYISPTKTSSSTSTVKFSPAQIPSDVRTSTKTKSDTLSFSGLLPNTKYNVYYGTRQINELCINNSKEIIERYGKSNYEKLMKRYLALNSNTYRNFNFLNSYILTDSRGNLHFQVLLGAWSPYSRNVNDFNRNIPDRLINEVDITLVPEFAARKYLTTTNSTLILSGRTVNTKIVNTPTNVDVAGKVTSSIVLNPFSPVLSQMGVWSGTTLKSYNPITISQNIYYDMVQTFYLDTNSFDGSKTVDVTELGLYFKNLPGALSTGIGSSLYEPGIRVCLLDIDVDGTPITNRQYEGSIVYKSSSECSTSSDATVDTNFVFAKPIRLHTGKFYGIGIIRDTDAFDFWTCRTGDRIVGTNKPSTGSSKGHRGELFVDVSPNPDLVTRNRMILQKARDNLDLKFDLYVAEYDTRTQDIPLVFKDYEFLSVSSTTVDPIGGEYFYKSASNAAGTITVDLGSDKIVGTGTSFTTLKRNDLIVITDGTTDNTAVVEVGSIVDDQLLYLEDASSLQLTSGNYKFTPIGLLRNYNAIENKMILDDSTAANSSFCFEDGDTIIGVSSGINITINTVDSYPISVFNIDFDINNTGKSVVGGKYNFSYYDGSNWKISENSTFEETLIIEYANHVDTYETNNVKYNPSILSRSLEVKNTTYLFDENEDTFGDKSATITLTYGHSGASNTSYESPGLRIDGTNVLVHHWKIQSDLPNEAFNYGNSNTKHISKQLVLGENKSAEDIVVIYNAYRPQGTDIHVYAKIINIDDPDAFDDKLWTKLELTSGENSFSSKTERGDWKEYTYGFPAFPPSESTLTGTATTVEDSVTVTGVGTTFTSDLTAGDVIKIYSPIFPANYGVFQVTTVTNNTIIVLNQPVSNVNIVDEGLSIDKISTQYTAFNNADNLNIVRYFTPNGVYDTYNTVAIKTVLASDNAHVVPFVNDYRVIAVSA
jgi:hypothetical protein